MQIKLSILIGTPTQTSRTRERGRGVVREWKDYDIAWKDHAFEWKDYAFAWSENR